MSKNRKKSEELTEEQKQRIIEQLRLSITTEGIKPLTKEQIDSYRIKAYKPVY